MVSDTDHDLRFFSKFNQPFKTSPVSSQYPKLAPVAIVSLADQKANRKGEFIREGVCSVLDDGGVLLGFGTMFQIWDFDAVKKSAKLRGQGLLSIL